MAWRVYQKRHTMGKDMLRQVLKDVARKKNVQAHRVLPVQEVQMGL